MLLARTLSRTAIALVLAGAFVAGCGDDDAVAQSAVEQEAEAQLAAQIGEEPDITCPGDLDAEVGATMECELTLEGDDGVYPVYVEVTSIEGDRANFDVVADFGG
jgi:hypothetical protein